MRVGAYVDLGFMMLMSQGLFDYVAVSMSYLYAKRSCIIKLELPGCDEVPNYQISMNIEMRPAKLSRGKGEAQLYHKASVTRV